MLYNLLGQYYLCQTEVQYRTLYLVQGKQPTDPESRKGQFFISQTPYSVNQCDKRGKHQLHGHSGTVSSAVLTVNPIIDFGV